MELKNILKLADLNINPEEESKISKDLQEVIDFNVEKLKSVDVSDVKPSYQVGVSENVLGEDESRPSLSEEEIFLNTDRKKDGSFKVKAILQ